MLWLAESLKVAPEDSRDLDRAVRTSLAAWYGQLHSLRAVVRYPAVQFPPVQRPPLAGSFTEGPLGSYTMTGSGTDIWGTADQFHFAYKTLTGPGSVAVRVDRLENTHEWAKAGVMIRDTTAPDSAFAAVFITPENRVCLQYRLATGQNALSIHTDPNAITLPHWIRLVREGNTFKAQHSEDGRQWKDLKGGSTFPVTTTRPAVVNVDLNDSIRVGLALTSHTEAERCQAVFSDFRTTGSVSAEWAHQDIHGDANVTKSPYPRQINSVTFSSDGSRLLVGRQDRAIWICDSSTGESISKPLYHGSPVTEVAASPHGKRIAARGLDGSLRLWDAATLEPVGELLHHEMGEARGCSMAFSPDGSWLRTEGAEGIAHYWDADTGTSLDKTLPTAFAAGDFWIDGVRVYKGDYVALDGDNSPRHGNAVNLLANGGFEAGAIEPWSTHGDIRAEVVGDLMNAAIPEDVVEGSSCLHVVVPEVGANYWDAGLWHTGHSFKAGTKYTLSLFLKSRAGLQDINVRLVLGADPSTCLDQKTVTITERWAEYSLTTPVLPEDIGPASITFHCVGEGKRDAVAMASCSEGLRVVRRMDWSKYQMFDGDRGRPIGPPVDNTGSTTALAISPDGSRFATIKIHSLIQIWDAATAEPLFDPIVQGGAIYALAFSPDGSRLVSAGNTRIAMLWDAATGEPIGAPLRQRDTIRTAAFSPDGRRVATGNQDGVLRIWDVIRDKCVSKSVVHEDPILGVACGPDGFRMLTETDGAIQVRDAATGKPIGRPIPHPGRIDFIVFSPDGARLATSSRTDTDDAWYVRLYDLARGELVGKPFHRGTARMAFSPDGSRILTGGWDNVVRLWDVATLGCLGEFHQHQRPVSAVAYSPNGSQFLTGSYDGTTQLWNAATLEPIGTPLVHQSEVKDAEFSPDGTQFLIGFADGTVRLWDAATRKPVGTPLQQLKVVSNVAFSPDGSRLLACCIDRTARLWDSATLKPIGPPLEHESWWPTMSSFSPDGSEILVADRYPTAAIWQAPPDPLGGDYERTVCWVQVVTGLELDPTGGINVLDAPTWQQRCRRLQELGGPPEVILSRL
jgi:WD40 repeat protein